MDIGQRGGLVLVHGSPGGPSAWEQVRGYLPDDLPTTTPRLPGHGRDAAEGVPPPTTLDALAADVEAQLGQARGPVVLAGFSFGAVVALEVAQRGALDLAGLVLFEPVAVTALHLGGHGAAQAEATARLAAYVAAAGRGEPDAIGTMIDFWFGDGAFAALPPRARQGLGLKAPVNARDVAATLATSYEPSRLAGLEVPTTIVWGSASPPVTSLIAASLAEALPRARVAVVEGASHGLLDTHADDVAGFILAALDAPDAGWA